MIKLSGNDVTFGKNTVSQSGQRMLTRSGIRGSVLSGKRTTGFHWNGHRFPPPASGSVLYLPGYPAQGSTIQDFSGSGNNGTITGAIWKRLPSGLWYLDLDGSDDKIEVDHSADFDFGTGDFSVSIWWNCRALPGDNLYGNLIMKRTGNDGWQLYGREESSALTLFALCGQSKRIRTGYAINEWHHYFAKRESGTTEFELDGVLDDTTLTSTNDVDIATDLIIGGQLAGQEFLDVDITLEEVSSGLMTNPYSQERHLFGR